MSAIPQAPLVAPGGPLLQADNLAWSPAPAAPALIRQVSLSLQAGEFTGLIGPNGAGKSSLIRLLLGYHRPQAGSISLAGRPLAAWSGRERARLVSYCAQDIPAGFPYSLRDLVEMGRFAHQTPRHGIPADPPGLVDSIIEYVGLSHLAHRAFDSLSGGEKQLALFARALAQDGRLFILDEPASGLDIGTEHRLFSMLRELCREGRGVLTAVHNLNTAAEYCDRLILLAQGTVVASGPPQEVLVPGLIESVYGLPVRVGTSDLTGAPLVQHCPPPSPARSLRVHLIGGGGSAINLTRQLVRLGVAVSGGVAHAFDSDSRLWQNLGIPCVEVPPYAPIDDAAFAAAGDLVRQADLVIVTEFPFGPGNVRNIDLALQAGRVVVVSDHGSGGRIFFDQAIRQSFQRLLSVAQVAESRVILDLVGDLLAAPERKHP